MKFPSGLHVRQVYAVRVHAVGPGSEQRVVTRFRGPLDINHNPRNGLPYFNVSLFSLPAAGHARHGSAAVVLRTRYREL
jgi:hypothetical protein